MHVCVAHSKEYLTVLSPAWRHNVRGSLGRASLRERQKKKFTIQIPPGRSVRDMNGTSVARSKAEGRQDEFMSIHSAGHKHAVVQVAGRPTYTPRGDEAGRYVHKYIYIWTQMHAHATGEFLSSQTTPFSAQICLEIRNDSEHQQAGGSKTANLSQQSVET